MSLKPVADRLAELLGKEVTFVPETRGEALEAAVAALRKMEMFWYSKTLVSKMLTAKRKQKRC